MRAILAPLFLCGALAAGQAQAEPSDETIAHGKALVEAGGCISCHTADPAKPFAGGKRIDTPFGAIFSPNLTPDRDSGIGAWSDQDFYRALRYGVAPDGLRYYPAFPYPNFTKLTRDDILAIRAYLATLAPFQNEAPPPQLRFPLNFRVVMRAWNFLFFKPGHFRARSEQERGIQSRRLPRHRRRALRRLPHAEKLLWRRPTRPRICRRRCATAGSRRGSTAPSAAA